MLCVLLMNIAAVLCASPGYRECPCIDENDAHLNAAWRAQLSNEGYPDGYGARGCKQYDLNLKPTGCDVLATAGFCDRYRFLYRRVTVTMMSMCLLATHCLYADSKESTIYRLWCYVDVEKCPISESKCIAAGGVVGSDLSPYCRTRQHVRTSINASSNLYYSYATCGAVDFFSDIADKFKRASGGHNLRLSVPSEDYPPWVFKEELDKEKPIWRGHTGVQPFITGQQTAFDSAFLPFHWMLFASCDLMGCSSCLVT
jgi:hypothetical protein